MELFLLTAMDISIITAMKATMIIALPNRRAETNPRKNIKAIRGFNATNEQLIVEMLHSSL